jgi:hypothetical protein
MKKLYKFLFVLALVGTFQGILNAQVIYSESFNYSGNLEGNGGWSKTGTSNAPATDGAATIQTSTFGTGTSVKLCFETGKKTFLDKALGQTILSDADADGTVYWMGFWYNGTAFGTAGAAQIVLVGTAGVSVDLGTGGNEGARNQRLAFGKTSNFTVTGPPVDGAMTVFTRASPGGCAAQNWTTTSAPTGAAPGAYKSSVASYYVLVKIIKGGSVINFSGVDNRTDDIRIWHLTAAPTTEPSGDGDYGVINTRMLRDHSTSGIPSNNTGNLVTNAGCRKIGGGVSGLRFRIEAGATSGTSCVEFDEIRIAKGDFSNLILPIELAELTATKKGASNIVKWATATETNNKGFHIERSNDAASWETLGFVKGAGNSQEKLSYSFIDSKPSSISYYRLRQEDFDGKTTHSKAVSVVQNGAFGVKVSPNPVSDIINIALVSEKETEKNFVAVYDVVGRLVFTTQFSGNNSELNVSELVPGIYFMNVQADGKTTTQKFIKE